MWAGLLLTLFVPHVCADMLHFTRIGAVNVPAEIVAVHEPSQRIFVSNGESNKIDVISYADLSDIKIIFSWGFTSIANAGSLTSVDVSGDIVAVALPNADTQSNGWVVLFDANGGADATPTFTFDAGALPDHVHFTPDGKYVLTANEGEPSDDYTNDPEGSVTIVDIAAATAHQVSFTDFNEGGSKTLPEGVRIFTVNGVQNTVANDLEPEYMAFSADSSTAYVTLQENNGVAVVDIAGKTVSEIWDLGTVDWGTAARELDPSNRDDGINFRHLPGLIGFRQPDSIASHTVNGVTYLFMANEGDARDYGGYSEELRIKDLEDTSLTPEQSADEMWGRLKVTSTYGQDTTGKYTSFGSYGARSFSVFKEDGTMVYDSGDFIERWMAANATEQWDDERSDDKGPEPEAAAVGVIDGTPYFFLGMERTSNVMAFDISNPAAPVFSGNFYDERDTAPECLKMFSGPFGSKLIVGGFELTGTVIYIASPHTTLTVTATPINYKIFARNFAANMGLTGENAKKVIVSPGAPGKVVVTLLGAADMDARRIQSDSAHRAAAALALSVDASSIPAGTPCSGTFTDAVNTYHWTSSCTGATTHRSACTLTAAEGYTGGSLTCDTSTGTYRATPGTAVPAKEEEDESSVNTYVVLIIIGVVLVVIEIAVIACLYMHKEEPIPAKAVEDAVESDDLDESED